MFVRLHPEAGAGASPKSSRCYGVTWSAGADTSSWPIRRECLRSWNGGVSPTPGHSSQTLEARHNGLSGITATWSVSPRHRDGRSLCRQLVAGGWSSGASPRSAHRRTSITLVSSACRYTSTLRTAGCGPACLVVWEGNGEYHSLSPIPICLLRCAPRNFTVSGDV